MKIGVVAFRIVASPLEIRVSPKTISVNGMIPRRSSTSTSTPALRDRPSSSTVAWCCRPPQTCEGGDLIYEYDCPSCGPFTAFRSMSEYAEPAACDECGAAAPRGILNAPAIAGMDAGLRRALAINERSRNAPRRSSGTHPSGRGCCSTSKRPKCRYRRRDGGRGEVLRRTMSLDDQPLKQRRSRCTTPRAASRPGAPMTDCQTYELATSSYSPARRCEMPSSLRKKRGCIANTNRTAYGSCPRLGRRPINDSRIA